MFVKPARPGLIVRDPLTLQPLDPKGEEVEESRWWLRRLKDGDIEVVERKSKKSEEATS